MKLASPMLKDVDYRFKFIAEASAFVSLHAAQRLRVQRVSAPSKNVRVVLLLEESNATVRGTCQMGAGPQ